MLFAFSQCNEKQATLEGELEIQYSAESYDFNELEIILKNRRVDDLFILTRPRYSLAIWFIFSCRIRKQLRL